MKHIRLFALLVAVALSGLGCQLTYELAAMAPAAETPAEDASAQTPSASVPPGSTPAPARPSRAATLPASASTPARPGSTLISPATTLTPVTPVAAGTPLPPPPCTNPNAAITFPKSDTTVSGVVEIVGTASRPDLQFWRMEYRTDVSTEFIEITTSKQSIKNALLTRWSTKTLPNGIYWLQLTVMGKDGNLGTPCLVRFKLAN